MKTKRGKPEIVQAAKCGAFVVVKNGKANMHIPGRISVLGCQVITKKGGNK